MDNNCTTVLVVGAGASGLAFALECAHHNICVHIIDKRPNRSMIGKATGVSAGVWGQLAKFGISPDSSGNAIPMRNFIFYDDGKLVANVPVPKINGVPPAYLYPQGELERQMETALSDLGIKIDYGLEFLSYEETDGRVDATIKTSLGEVRHLGPYKMIIGADGAHSAVRESAGIPFLGREYPESWSVAEVATNQWSPDAQAKLFLQSNGVGLFLSQPSPGTVQGILNDRHAAKELLSHFSDGSLLYERCFKVSLKRVPSPRKGHIWLIGDAAHVQSPVGGQGLNLAIWDGITLAKAISIGNLGVDTTLAHRAKLVLRFTHFDYRMLSSKNRFIRLLRNTYWEFSAKHPRVSKWFFKIISGFW